MGHCEQIGNLKTEPQIYGNLVSNRTGIGEEEHGAQLGAQSQP